MNSGLRVTCGNFSYANIADKFKYIMGVTGTLESISEVQTKIIVNHFKIYEQTFIPSVFGKNNLNFSPIQDVILEDHDENYKAAIRKQIDNNLYNAVKGYKRAVIVLINDEKTLLDLYKSDLFDDMRK